MKLWRWILLLVILAALAAFGWHWVAEDPGYVMVQLRGWQAETTAVAALVMLLVAWGLLSALWFLLRWPFGAFSRRHRRISRQRMREGLIALMEGRHGDAERDLHRASRLGALRAPALLAAAEAASRRGENSRALATLDEAGQVAPRAARVLRARVLRREGKAAEAVNLLAPEADNGNLTPGGWRELALASLASGDTRRARQTLEPLQKSGAFGIRALCRARRTGARRLPARGTRCRSAQYLVVTAAQGTAPGACGDRRVCASRGRVRHGLAGHGRSGIGAAS